MIECCDKPDWKKYKIKKVILGSYCNSCRVCIDINDELTTPLNMMMMALSTVDHDKILDMVYDGAEQEIKDMEFSLKKYC